MKLNKIFLSVFLTTLITACSIPVDAPPPPTALITATTQPALIASPTFPPTPTLTQTPAALQATTTANPQPFCSDLRGSELIASLKSAVAAKDGTLLASLVSPSNGMDVRYYRDGNVVNYDVEHAKFVFETTFQADWGLSFGSGEPTLGSFQEIILPALQIVFTPNAEVTCNQLKVGGATYMPEWPYPGTNYYSVHFAGTDQYGGMDWQTWAVGMETIAGKPYITALVHYVWEP